MRDISFKAKIRGIDKPLYVLLIDFGNCVTCVIDADRGTQSTYDWHMVEELLEYTGLKDKNGKEIYEGDIVIAEDSTHRVVEYCNSCCQYELAKYTEGEGGSLNWTGDINWNYLEIIGNEYENKELLK